MGRHYSHIDLAERRRIQQMRDAKHSVAAIAASLGASFHHSSRKQPQFLSYGLLRSLGPSVLGVFLRDGGRLSPNPPFQTGQADATSCFAQPCDRQAA